MSTNPYQPPSYIQPMPAFGPDAVEAAKSRLSVPAWTLLILAAITAVLRVAGLAINFLQLAQGQGQEAAFLVGSIGGNGMALLSNLATIVGAWKMKDLQSYRSAMTAAVISVIPLCSPCLVLGIPFGIWAIVILMKPEVKAVFRN